MLELTAIKIEEIGVIKFDDWAREGAASAENSALTSDKAAPRLRRGAGTACLRSWGAPIQRCDGDDEARAGGHLGLRRHHGRGALGQREHREDHRRFAKDAETGRRAIELQQLQVVRATSCGLPRMAKGVRAR